MAVKNKEIEEIMNEYGRMSLPFLFIIDFEGEQAKILTEQEVKQQGILFQTIDYQNYSTLPSAYQPFIFQKFPINFEVYQTAFRQILKEINFGNTYLLNLTFPTPIRTDLSLEDVFHRSAAKFKLLYPGKFVVFSPEIFVKIHQGVISSYPMKGTIDAGIENAENIILSDLKEEAEHNTIVDLIRNDLSMVAHHVRVEKFRYIERLVTNQKTLLQVSSHIAGDLPQGYQNNIGTIITRLLPAGSISGAPKAKTVEIIQSVESGKRGYYTGVFGYFDGKNLESAVMIRFIEETTAGMLFRSGGGITFMSDCEMEYHEMIDKVYVPIV